ncbi:hypothetical protein L2E82_21550 [Cichorium intybus]|uniref:Uncharacterized protein n=1 Tax=Cichorium intybus TaxID=13427 RepID=A0ACB9DWC5_CICIN|nr:hypothetical protein L2E82_21550 [Cichorium intybus]
MKRVFGVKKDKEPPPSLNEASDRINKRGTKDNVTCYTTKPLISTKSLLLLRVSKMLNKHALLESMRGGAFSVLCLEVAVYLHEMSALKSANKELKGMMKTIKIQDVDNLQDDMMELMDVSNEIQESLGRTYNVPDDIDEEDLMGELDALEADMGMETASEGVPSYLQPDNEPDFNEELNLPSAPSGHAVPAHRVKGEDEFGLPPVPRASLRG